MRNSNSKLRKVLPVIAGLAIAGNAAAQTVDDSFFNRTGDFIMVTQYMHQLPRDTKTSIDSLLSGPNATSIYAVDPIVGLNNRIKFLKAANSSKGSKEFRSEEERKLLIGRYESFISEISKDKRSSDYGKSLSRLTDSVKDGTISPKELEEVEDGFYMIVKEGKANGCDNPYGVFALVRLTKGDKDSCKPEVYGFDLTKPILQAGYYPPNSCPKQEAGKKDDSTLYGGIPGFPLFLPEAPKEISKVPEEKKIGEKKQEGVYVSLLAQGNANSAFDSFGASVGARVSNKTIGLGALLDLGFGLDKLVDSYSGPLSAERTAYGTVTDTNKLSIGGSLELKIGPCMFGVGADYSNWVKKTTEQILDKYGNEVKSNINSEPNRQVFVKGYTGFEFGSEDLKARITAGYHEREGFYFGAGTTIRLNQSKKRK